MATMQLTTIDCKVEVRKWILIATPSIWGQRGPRVIVYSPIVKASRDDLHIPVKRCSREDGDSVCLMPRGDIEKDTSRIYNKSQVSTKSSSIDAHGIALVDSLNDDFKFARNDKFWIDAGSNVERFTTTNTVPVINLRTFETGVVRAEQVCWVPKLRGPNEELWTPAGKIRKLKLSKPGQFSYWSFAIRQNLDGTAPTVDNIPMPDQSSRSKDKLALATAERRALFQRIYHIVTRKCSESKGRLPSELSPSPVPPPSLDTAATTLLSPPASVNSTDQEDSKEQHKACTVDHPMTENVAITGGNVEDGTGVSEYSFSTQGTDSISVAVRTGPDFSSPDTDKVRCARWLAELAEDRREDASNSRYFGTTLDQINERYHRAKGAFGLGLALGRTRSRRLCDLSDPVCKYSEMYPFKHYHIPAHECPSIARHDHCVCRKRPLPGNQGGCLLMSKNLRRHRECCYLGTPRLPPIDVRYDDRKQKEAWEKGLPVYDFTSERSWGECHNSLDDISLVL